MLGNSGPCIWELLHPLRIWTVDSGCLVDCRSCPQWFDGHKHTSTYIFAQRLRGKGSLATILSIQGRIMPRFTRGNTTEGKRRKRNERNKRKRLLRTAKQREAVGILRQMERAAYSRAKEMARSFYLKWRQLAEQNKTRTLDRTKVSLHLDTSKTHKKRSLKPPASVVVVALS